MHARKRLSLKRLVFIFGAHRNLVGERIVMPGSNSNMGWGLVLVAIGALLLLNQTTDFAFWDFIGDWWPLALIVIGLWMIFQQTRSHRHNEEHLLDAADTTKAFGSLNIAPTVLDSSGKTYKIAFGDILANFSDTDLRQGENKIEIALGFGDINITLPKDKACKVKTACGLGDIDMMGLKSKNSFSISEEHEDENYSSADKKLYIQARVGTGNIKIKRAL